MSHVYAMSSWITHTPRMTRPDRIPLEWDFPKITPRKTLRVMWYSPRENNSVEDDDNDDDDDDDDCGGGSDSCNVMDIIKGDVAGMMLLRQLH